MNRRWARCGLAGALLAVCSVSFGEDGAAVTDTAGDVAISGNQAFYAPRAPKRAVVRSSEFLEDSHFSVLDAAGVTVIEGVPTYWGECWSNHCWIVDFSAVTNEGSYGIHVTFSGNGNAASMSAHVATEPIAAAAAKTLEYFRIQRCGVEIPGWHKSCHLDDAVLPDGTHRDSTGGWHDCAGFDKEMYTTFLAVYAYATIAAETDEPLRARMMEEARWGADWIMRMTDSNGYTWCHVDPHNLQPDDFIRTWTDGVDTDNKVGTPDDRPLTQKAWGPEEPCQAACMGVLAKVGFLLRESDPAYAQRCLETARRMRTFLKTADYVYAERVPLGAGESHYALFRAGMLMGDTYLALVDGSEALVEDGRRQVDFIVTDLQDRRGEYLTSSIERQPQSKSSFDPYFCVIAMYEFQKRFPNDPSVPRIHESVRQFMDESLPKRLGRTPYGQAQKMDADTVNWIAVKTTRRFFEKPSGLVSQGGNCYWLAVATVSFLADEMLNTDRYADVGIRQIDWVLGNNPFGLSTVAGVGTQFPRMFTMFYWLTNHPAASGVIPGGAINGIGGDANDFPALDLRNNNWLWWETNEYWNPPTAWFALACWKYYQYAKRPGTE